MIKTSDTHPLRIDFVQPQNAAGLIGMTFCPGKIQSNAMSGGDWNRNLEKDVEAIAAWGVTVALCLLEDHEIQELQVNRMHDVIGSRMRYFRMPIVDGGIPDQHAEGLWHNIGTALRTELARGGKIVIFCKGGLGRTGTIAAKLLIELGEDPESAMVRVRKARTGAIETRLQSDYLRSGSRE